MGKVLAHDPPRDYTPQDARRGRPWRPAPIRVGVECMVIGGALLVLGIAMNHPLGLYGGGVIAGAGLLAALVGGPMVYRRWAALVQRGPQVEGRLGHTRPLVLIHELLKPERERTSVQHYEYVGPDGQRYQGRILICNCVRDRLPSHSTIPVAVDPEAPARSVPLKLAVMVAHPR